ncbi:MAG: hypothetical protein JWL99_50 [Streptomyces oryziradicis]|uniref:Uncharacterized protein n=1 Tax=Actinacidiphila oryziradicis TaxID=2571141 RepID=A0A4U0RVQ7_9ACTN|nr:hypothetical protein [Actinacidiphila oryziradicis]MCW2868730.1 hypothetical protein [Actinacidiphila oryziradicis]TJZ99632.1 hypothetical protein FCI23_45040 [Actinacidiphila oryziradicis]
MGIWWVVGDLLLAVLGGLTLVGLALLVWLQVARASLCGGGRSAEETPKVLRRHVAGEIDGHECERTT